MDSMYDDPHCLRYLLQVALNPLPPEAQRRLDRIGAKSVEMPIDHIQVADWWEEHQKYRLATLFGIDTS